LLTAPPAAADEFRDKQWHLQALNVAEAHKLSMGDGVVVAVVDSGVKADHPDLAGNVLPGVDLTGANTAGQQDTNGHGTAMAGLIAAHGHGGNNADGALGLAPHSKILPIRDSTDGRGTAEGIAAGIDAAVRAGARVISVSLGLGPSARLGQAIKDALAADIVVVASSGNRPQAAFLQFPAAYPGVVAVGATDRAGNIAPVSVTGNQLALTAPGVDIVSTDGLGGYRIGTGTSDSTAIVAGAVALVRSKFPKLPATEVVHRLTATATDKGAPGRDPQYGYGALNLVSALTADVKPETPSAAPTTTQAQQPTAGPADTATATPLRLSPAFFICIATVGVLVLGGAGLIVWLVARRRNQPAGPPAPGGYPAPGYGPPPPQAPSPGTAHSAGAAPPGA
jgi:type VII secretion-associated serine protease mycosin